MKLVQRTGTIKKKKKEKNLTVDMKHVKPNGKFKNI